MSTAIHGSFTINRFYDASPARLYGGREMAHGRFPDRPETRFVASYHEIVPSERLVYAYGSYIDGRLISVSLATVEMIFQSGKTELRITKQGVFFDSQDGNERRREGTEYLCSQIAAHLKD